MDSSIHTRAVTSSSSDLPSQFGDVTYTVEVITLYKGESETYVEDGNITFLTKASSGLCGISLYAGDDAEGDEKEYLLGLSSAQDGTTRRASSVQDGTTLRAELCGINEEWSSIDVPLLESCASTPSPAQPTPSPIQSAPSSPPIAGDIEGSPAQQSIQAESDDVEADFSSALGLVVSRRLIDYAGVVLRGNALRRNTPVDEDQSGEITYNIRIITLFKTEEGVDYPEEITITTADAVGCGIYLDVGNEYLLDLLRSGDDLWSVGLCGATQSWTTLSKEKIATLEDIDAACTADPCADCGEFEECLFYTGDLADDQYYCSAVCDPSLCDEGEECSLTVAGCSAGSICGNGYVCSPNEGGVGVASTGEEDPCEGRCPDSHECLFYTGNIADDQYYCSAVCDPSPCDEGEECRLTTVGCSAGSICGAGYICSPADDDDGDVTQDVIVEDCSACGEFQECHDWASDADAEYFYCADVCEPSPCTNGETCSLELRDDCGTDASPCPPVATCTAQGVAAGSFSPEEEEDDSSALRLATGSLATIAVLTATLLLEL
eukprot:g2178.t1